MFLKHLELVNFRNHKSVQLDFSKRLVFFIGDNGAGKTNIIESISLLPYFKSFRGTNDEEFVSWGSEHMFIKALLEGSNQTETIEIGLQLNPKTKKIKRNSKTILKKTDLISIIPIVILSPNDLIIIEGGSIERRKYFDKTISSFDTEYLESLLRYQNALKNRNALLKFKEQDRAIYHPWEKILIEETQVLRSKRNSFVTDLMPYFNNSLGQLSRNLDNTKILYKPNMSEGELMSETYEKYFYRELKVGYTLKGPHKDDIHFVNDNGIELEQYGSQGQKRSAVIALKTSLYEYTKIKYKLNPILIIDDVIKELDLKRREYFVDLIRNAGQSFFTTTDLSGIEDYMGNLSESREIFEVKDGNVRLIES
jgi:DNA replication and repair protein RecF